MSASNAQNLVSFAEDRFDTLADIDGSEELLAQYDHHAFRFDADDGDGFLVDIHEGEVTVQPPEEWDEASISRPPTVISASRETLEAVLVGEETIVDGVWGGTVRAPVYGAQMGYTSWISRILKAIRNGRVD